MKYFENFLMRTKLLLGFGLIWLMFIVVIFVAYSGITSIMQSVKKLHNVEFKIALQATELRSRLNNNRSAMLEMMMTTDKSKQIALENDVNERVEIIEKIIENLSILQNDPLFQSRLKELQDNHNAFHETRNEVILLIKAGKMEEAKQLGTGIQGERFEKIRLLSYALADQASKDSDDQIALDLQQANTSIRIFVIFGFVSLLFIILIVILMNKTIAKPLDIISKLASQIASGDLRVAVSPEKRKDEVGMLNLAFSQMQEKLRGSIKEIVEGINLLGSSASEILAATTQVASGSSETASAISETTTTVEEVRQAAQLSSQKAGRVSANSQQISQVTQTGQFAVEETVSGMHLIQNQMESIANTIIRLSEQSQQIGGIIASVNDVADQSNLLAVNAAIEAAKAGEQGKGFAVVAQEIKTLALQSKQATIQVRNILSDVQKATSAAVMATEQGSKAVENGVKQSTQAGESIRQLAQSVNESVQAATQIVASSQQQVVGMDQVSIAMNNINQASAENAASMTQAEKAARDLNDLGQKLKQLVEQYKI